MNQQDQGSGSGSASNVPVKRKRGRPRKVTNVQVPEVIMPALPAPHNVLNSNQTADTTNEMLGKSVTGVIEGAWKDGYLLNVKVENSDTCLRGLAFLPGQTAPITPENDVAPHIQMIQRREIPIPVRNPQDGIHGPVPSTAQSSKQSFGPELQVPISGGSVSSEHRAPSLSASTVINVPISAYTGGIPLGTLDPGHVNQSASIASELKHDKTVKQGETLHQLEASTQVKESSADGGTTKEFEPASEPIGVDPIPAIENTDKELGISQQAVPHVHQPNEVVVHDEPNTSNVELNLIPGSAEHQAVPSGQTSKPVDNIVEMQDLAKTIVLDETSSKVDTSNSDERPSSHDVSNIPDVVSNLASGTSQPGSMPSEQIGEPVSSESKLTPSEGCDLQ